jgi:large subunit ribosomal protein L25
MATMQSTLAATVRTAHGKAGMHKLRQQGQVPGVIYGLGKPVSIQCEHFAAEHAVQASRRGSRLIALKLEDGNGGSEKHVLLKDVQVTPVGHKLVHLDFQEIDVNKPVQLAVRVHPVGNPEGIKAGGLLQTVTHEILISCLPTHIPQMIEVNVDHLDIGDSLHVKEVKFPEGVRPITGPDETVFVITAPTAVAEEKAAAAAAAAAALAAEAAALEAGVPLEGAVPAEGTAPAAGAVPGKAAAAPGKEGAPTPAPAAATPVSKAPEKAAPKARDKERDRGKGGRGR